ncbi:ring-hydroxylating dioxygenase subunit beta [Xylophilus rhododendri]|uniref:Ring-hydroxylating dioxygenase subunit beta n=1 Tax=Xylophilus rhododendri TaxID=2697032 RepID=A0A857J9M3_9BURK|nr:nuclear transport factor 2 family protein [Xylophilus rhododendri]QHI99692.1 ring-hydroxylating dioxygenase subunit beta [Xylophilus rhododendri]
MSALISKLFRPRRIALPRAIELAREVEAFNAEYCAVLDAGMVEQWPDFFTEDGVYRITARENAELNLPVGLVYAEGRDMMIDRAIAIGRTQMFAPRYNLHLVSNTRVTEELADGGIVAQANFVLLQTLVEGPSTIHMAGTFHDRFVRRDGGLLLAERQAIYDTTIIANDLVYPL